MTPIVLKAIEAAGLGDVLAARRAGDLEGVRAAEGRMLAADLLAVGALADAVRAEEVGDVVRVHTHNVQSTHIAPPGVLLGAGERGLELLRRVAIARLTAPRGAAVAVDWAAAGFEIAQVALGFGASELLGPVQSRRGLPIAEDAAKKVKGQGMVAVATLKKQEISGMIRRTGRTPLFDDEPEGARGEAAPATQEEAR